MLRRLNLLKNIRHIRSITDVKCFDNVENYKDNYIKLEPGTVTQMIRKADSIYRCWKYRDRFFNAVPSEGERLVIDLDRSMATGISEKGDWKIITFNKKYVVSKDDFEKNYAQVKDIYPFADIKYSHTYKKRKQVAIKVTDNIIIPTHIDGVQQYLKKGDFIVWFEDVIEYNGHSEYFVGVSQYNSDYCFSSFPQSNFLDSK